MTYAEILNEVCTRTELLTARNTWAPYALWNWVCAIVGENIPQETAIQAVEDALDAQEASVRWKGWI